MTNNVIQINDLSYRYGKVLAVKQVELAVKEGEIFGFLGPNGAGKTTTIRAMLDFIRPLAGTIQILGMDSQQDSVAIHGRIGYLPSELVLWENWTGVQYLRWLEKVRQQSVLPEGLRLAERFQFDLGRKLGGMSTGMKRKMGIIAALAHKPELLILDEPTTGLDPLMQQEFHELMHETRREGRSVFLSSHMLNEVEQICDRVGIIREGELTAVETVNDLTSVKFRWMSLEVAGDSVQADGFTAIDGVSEMSVNGASLRMKVSGSASIDAVIKQAATLTLKDLRFEQPSLEEIFLAYYNSN